MQSRNLEALDRQVSPKLCPHPCPNHHPSHGRKELVLGSGHLPPDSCGKAGLPPPEQKLQAGEEARTPPLHQLLVRVQKWSSSLVSGPRKVRRPWQEVGYLCTPVFGVGMPVGDELMSDNVCGGHAASPPPPPPRPGCASDLVSVFTVVSVTS